MQTAVLAKRDSVRPSVILRYCVQMNEDSITFVRFPASGRAIPVVSEELKFIRIFAGDHLQRGVKVRHPYVDSENSIPIIGNNLETVQDMRKVTINQS